MTSDQIDFLIDTRRIELRHAICHLRYAQFPLGGIFVKRTQKMSYVVANVLIPVEDPRFVRSKYIFHVCV